MDYPYPPANIRYIPEDDYVPFLAPTGAFVVDDEDEYFFNQKIWIEDDEEPIIIDQVLNSFSCGRKVRIYPRGSAPNADLLAQIKKEYKQGLHPKEGVLETVFKDVYGVNWFQVLTVVNNEPLVILLNLKYWVYEE
jgi:hypothetical protein